MEVSISGSFHSLSSRPDPSLLGTVAVALLRPISCRSGHLRPQNWSQSLHPLLLFKSIPVSSLDSKCRPRNHQEKNWDFSTGAVTVTDHDSGRSELGKVLGFVALFLRNSAPPVPTPLVAGLRRIEGLNSGELTAFEEDDGCPSEEDSTDAGIVGYHLCRLVEVEATLRTRQYPPAIFFRSQRSSMLWSNRRCGRSMRIR